ncbi:hypothetical protein AAIH46_04800 [Rhizobium sp. 0TCS1.26]|uniref:hypothetical protein n=1 Tax=Rhizobium sp. 0TCS1.26 TaxID=3142623 RepID=UPI003D2953A3
MVSSLDSVRLWSTQTAIRIFKENDAQAASNDGGSRSMASSLLADYGIDSSDDDLPGSTYSLADLLAGSGASQTPSQPETPSVSDDVESVSFMAGLKAKLQELAASPSTKAQADAMLEALAAGTLMVTDAVKGEKILAWDTGDADAAPTKAASTGIAEWSSFLRDSLVREGGAKYQLKSDGSYTDKATGNSAYFGMIGDAYYYLTWSAAPAPAK